MSLSLSALSQLSRSAPAHRESASAAAPASQANDAFRDVLGKADRPDRTPRERPDASRHASDIDRSKSAHQDGPAAAAQEPKTTEKPVDSDIDQPDTTDDKPVGTNDPQASDAKPDESTDGDQSSAESSDSQTTGQASAANQAATAQTGAQQQVAQGQTNAQAGTQAAQLLPGQAATTALPTTAANAATTAGSENPLGVINPALNPYAGDGDGQNHNQGQANTGQQQAGQQTANQQAALSQAAAERVVARVDPSAVAIESANSASSSTQQASPANGQVNMTATVELPRAITTEDQANVQRVIRGLNTAVNQNGGQVNLRLNPPEMGIVRIQLEMSHQSVKVQIHTEQDAVRQLMTQQLAQLRHGLESQGLTVERISVQTAGANQSQLSQQDSDGQHDGRSRGFNQRDGQGQSRGQGDESKQERPKSFFDFLTRRDEE